MSFSSIQDLIAQYKMHIERTKFDDEAYKWQLIQTFEGRPDPESQNFLQEISSINFNNLIFYNAFRVMKHLAAEREAAYRDCYRQLFNINVSLGTRVKDFMRNVKALYAEIQQGNYSHHHDERTIATLLVYHDAEKYALYKDEFYRKYCQLIGVKPKPAGEKYAHYMELLLAFVRDHVTADEELLSLRQYLPVGSHADTHHLILAQDILYQMLEKDRNRKPAYWRIGTTEDETSHWEEMLTGNYVAIGWADLEDLSDVQTREDVTQRLRDRGFYPDKPGTLTRKAGEIFNFIRQIRVGDIVLAQDGWQVLGIGKVMDQYEYNEEVDFPHIRPVEWKIPEVENFVSEIGQMTSVYQIKNEEVIGRVELLLSHNMENTGTTLQHTTPSARNIILYGPPGTGKTFHSIDLAVNLATGKSSDLHKENKEVFDKLRKEGRIEFVTFHQSYGYEDFMLGLRPDLNADEGVKFYLYKGPFFRICQVAEQNYRRWKENSPGLRPFDDVMNEFFQPLFEDESPIDIKMQSGKTYTITAANTSNFSFRKPSGGTAHTLSLTTLQDLYYDRREIPQGLISYYAPLVSLLKEKGKQQNQVQLENFVLVIDEINRGNISKIFGELITLLEDDKRIGQENELSVDLPLIPQVPFAVPPNLHVIGTMNTADKSIALVDVALRRRFEFEGRYPDTRELEADSAALLEHLNNAILAQNKPADFLIGHAYFMKPRPIEETLTKSIIPLLMEYFAGKTAIVSSLFEGSGWSVLYDPKKFTWTINPA